MTYFKKAKDVLGMNSRNLEYIYKYNSHQDKKFADDKISTKQFLESRGIGVAKLFHVVKKHQQLTPAFFEALPTSFVVKPNKGYGGGGILVIENKKNNTWRTPSGRKLSADDLYLHCSEILDGKYAISGTTDTVLFEERLEPHPDFERLTEVGLTDVRIIVFNKVPIIAMLRVPTVESEGKANMELGAYGMGIDIGTGKTIGAAYFSKHIKKLPNGVSAIGFQVPYWEEILLSAAKIQAVTNIGYLGVDMVITKTGVKVLELNARSGLKIQIANRAPQKPRLRKVADLKIMTPEEGVKVAKTLFSENQSATTQFEERTVLPPKFDALLNSDEPTRLSAEIDLFGKKNKIRSEFFDEKSPLLDITVKDKRLKLPVEKDDSIRSDLVLAGKFLNDFYISPEDPFSFATVTTSDVDERKIKNIDEKICEIDEQIKLLSFINPRNIKEQKELFFSNPSYSPRFIYRDLPIDIPLLRRDLKKIPVVDHALYPLFLKKIEELENKINLLEAVGSDNFQDFSERVFGKVTNTDYKKALRFLQEHEDFPKDESPILSAKIAKEKVESFLHKYHLKHWKVKLIQDSVADMQVSKSGSILIRETAEFSKNRLESLLVHEVGTHVFRNENGKRQPFKLFQRGTAGYLQTEEGLAVYNQNALNIPLGEKFISPALVMVSIFMAKKLGFRDLFQFLKETYSVSDEIAWSRCLKAKRGFLDGEQKGAFTKDCVYFKGLEDVEKFLKKGHDISELYIGKIAISDLKTLKNAEGLEPPKLLL